jgi:hypothetical protein
MSKENLFEKHKKSGWNPFDTYTVKIKLRDIVGGLPMDPKLVEKWVNATNKTKSAEEREALKNADLALLPEATEEKKEQQGIGFARKDGQLVIEGRQVKAMLKEAANIIKNNVPGEPITQLKSKVADQVFVVEEFITLGRTEPDAVEQKPIHVMTAQGPRNSIKVYEICRGVNVEFTVKRHNQKGKQAVLEKVLLAILDYGQSIGLGADRSQGHGLFEVLSVEKDE